MQLQLQANNNKVWQAARTGNSPTKLATLPLRLAPRKSWYVQWI